MKQLAGILLSVLLVYVIYYDLNHGTLPAVKEQKIEAKEQVGLDYFSKEVEPGETVLSIVEKNLNRPIPVSIADVVKEFKKLNGGMKPQHIQTGETYKFPNYREKE
jgi:hypothetical protein